LTKEVALQILTTIADELEGLDQREAAKAYRRTADIVADIEVPRMRRRRHLRRGTDASTPGDAAAQVARPGRRRRTPAA
jgi:hypothetical protein